MSSVRSPDRVSGSPLGPALGAKGTCAFLTALLCLVAQVAGAAHLALVSHVRCFEHDALVHAESGKGHDRAAALERLAAGLGASGVPADTAQHADDHCFVVGLRRREHWVPTRTRIRLPEPPALASTSFPAPRPEILVGPVALLRFAPKASPPVISGRC